MNGAVLVLYNEVEVILEMRQIEDIKDEARKLIDTLPDNATWEDVVRTVFERLMIEEGIEDLEAGRVWTSDEIREKLGIL